MLVAVVEPVVVVVVVVGSSRGDVALGVQRDVLHLFFVLVSENDAKN
jgi:hypothetical protein